MGVPAVILLAVGLAVITAATHRRRQLWRAASPFAGDERCAPEPALVQNWIIYLVYLGWLVAIAGAGLGLAEVA